MDELQRNKCLSWKFQIVSDKFYEHEVEHRAKHILRAPSVGHLCKSLIMKNKKCIHKGCSNRLNSQYYLVLFPYDQKLKQQKLKKYVKNLSEESVSNKFYKFSLASSEETLALTGFEYNCVSPIGVGDIPLIISHHITGIDHMWIGSGSLNVKLCIQTKEFFSKYKHFVADITA